MKRGKTEILRDIREIKAKLALLTLEIEDRINSYSLTVGPHLFLLYAAHL